MRSGFNTAVLLALASIGCSRETPPTGPPRIHFAEREIDAGTIEVASGDSDFEFPFENRGLSTLEITHLVTSCGCLGATTESPRIHAGSRGSIVMTIGPQQSEERSATVTVHSNDPENPRVVLRLSWKAVAPLDIVPPSLDFGSVRPQETAEKELTVVRRSVSQECRIVEVTAQPPAQVLVTARSAAAGPGEPSGSAQFAVSVLGQGEAGLHYGTVVIRLEGCWRKELTVPVSWRVEDVIEAKPETLFVGSGGSGTLCEREFRLVSNVGRLAVDDVVLLDDVPNLKLELESRSENEALVHVKWELPPAKGRYIANVRVRCSSPEPREITVPVSVYVLESSDNAD